MEQFFPYGEHEIAYLKSRDKRLGEIIDKVGMVKRRVIPDLFAALVHSIVGQQIATKAHETIWRKMTGVLGEISPEKVLGLSPEELQAFGITFRKRGLHPVGGTENRIGRVRHPFIADDERCRGLRQVVGTGRYRRMDSGNADAPFAATPRRVEFRRFGGAARFADAVSSPQNHPPLFEKYRRRYSPYGSVACIYLWAVSAGAVEGLKDYAPKEKNDGRKRKNKGDSRP